MSRIQLKSRDIPKLGKKKKGGKWAQKKGAQFIFLKKMGDPKKKKSWAKNGQ